MADILTLQPRENLEVHIGDGVYQVPLEPNFREILEMRDAEDQTAAIMHYFAKYLGDAFDAIGDAGIGALFDAWSDARQKAGKASLGESSASPKS